MDRNANEDLRGTYSNIDNTSNNQGKNLNIMAQNTTPYDLDHTEEEFEIYKGSDSETSKVGL